MVRHVGQISINVFVRYSRLVGVSPFFFFPFYLPLIPLPPPPPYSLSLFSNHDREKRFVRSNDAQWSTCGARLFVERRNLNREPRLPRGAVITRIFSTAKDLYASFLVRARARARVPQEGRGETKNGEIETPRFTRRSRRDARAVEARGCDSRNTSGTRAYPVTVSFVPATICYFVHIHNAVTSSRTDAFSPPPLFPSLFFPSLFPPARTRTRLAPVTVHRYPRSA